MDYLDTTGESPFCLWLKGIPVDAEAQIDVRLLVMSGVLNWTSKWIKKYKGTDEIYELRVPFNKVQYRPLGAYAPQRRFVLLEGAIEKGGKLPRESIERAVERRKALERDPTRVRQHRYD